MSDYPEVFVPVESASRTTPRFDLFKVDHAMLDRVLVDRTAVASGPDAEPGGAHPPHEAAAGKAQP